MKVLFLILFFAIAKIQAQVKILGTVKNEGGAAVSYCSIGIKNSNIGTITDIDGKYIIDSLQIISRNSVIIFEAVGYESKTLSLEAVINNSDIVLKSAIHTLEEINIVGKKMKSTVIGSKKRPILTFSKMFDKNVPSVEQGNIFDIYDKTIINSYHFHIIPSSKYKNITLKLNIYSVKDNYPDQLILQENIIYKTSTTAWQTIDLKKYRLTYRNLDKIAITLQLVDYEPEESAKFIFGISAKKSLSKNLLYRYQSQGQWQLSDGDIISNIDINYTKNSYNESIKKQDENEIPNTLDEKALVDFYNSKELSKKTNYGKSKLGKFINIKDAKLYYEEYGSGSPVILLHGNNGSISDFYSQIPELSKHFRVIAIDTRGQGRSSDLSTNEYSYEIFADDLLKVFHELKIGKANIVGWSDGGNTGLTFNLKNPNLIQKLIIIGANINPEGVNIKLLNSLKIQLENPENKNRRLIKLMLNHPHIIPDQLKNIKNPVLVIAGSQDAINEEHTKTIKDNLPNSTLMIIPNATHYIPFEQPEILNKMIINFLK
ncbi:alpha/beta fold hydrolase [Chryseobacterium sp. SSA4.19]|uniref:alpha/beta fold hydrolase n=1 Tax=Chryseobacterium sp. SSA4.19 TaxID=2919915 RepID=UPI001F4E4D17|nr:alpha/beta hydrolase [Chryseobacterium sp. SSA4.19]MCJ8152508.1 alpha/beta fold hydrolase [Chryseobacterium sp. SSA4.19]